MKRSLFIYPLFFLGLLLAFGSCVSDAGEQAASDTLPHPSVDHNINTTDEEANGESQQEETMTRGLEGLARITDFNFQERFPMLYNLLKENPDDLEIVTRYARKVVAKEGLQTEQDILDLFDERQEQIIPIISPYLENLDSEKWYQANESYEAELNALGLRQITVEGMYTAIGASQILTDVLRTNVSSGLRQYADFCNYESLSRGGEYPYSNMEPYFDMILAGEKLMGDANARIFYEKVNEDFKWALRAVTDVHLLEEDGRQTPLVGGTHTEQYPYMSELDSHKEFVENHFNSRYAIVIEKILENTSSITARPENIYLIVTEWATSLNEAEDKVFENINGQKDVPHYLQVRRGNGKDEYAITYRFFEDETKANTALKTCRDSGIEAELLFVSVRNGQLYQIGI